MSRVMKAIETVIDGIQILLIFSIVGVIGAQILMRSAFDRPLGFPEEYSMFALIAVVLLGISVIEKENAHIKVEFFYEKLPHTGKKTILLLGKILTFMIVVAILNGERELFPRIFKLRTTAAGIPYLWIHTIIVVSCILWLLSIFYSFANILREKEA